MNNIAILLECITIIIINWPTFSSSQCQREKKLTSQTSSSHREILQRKSAKCASFFYIVITWKLLLLHSAALLLFCYRCIYWLKVETHYSELPLKVWHKKHRRRFQSSTAESEWDTETEKDPTTNGIFRLFREVMAFLAKKEKLRKFLFSFAFQLSLETTQSTKLSRIKWSWKNYKFWCAGQVNRWGRRNESETRKFLVLPFSAFFFSLSFSFRLIFSFSFFSADSRIFPYSNIDKNFSLSPLQMRK